MDCSMDYIRVIAWNIAWIIAWVIAWVLAWAIAWTKARIIVGL